MSNKETKENLEKIEKMKNLKTEDFKNFEEEEKEELENKEDIRVVKKEKLVYFKYVILSTLLIIFIGTSLAIIYHVLENNKYSQVKDVKVKYLNDNTNYDIKENYVKNFNSKKASKNVKKEIKSANIDFYIYEDGKVVKRYIESTPMASMERIYEFNIKDISSLNSFDDVYLALKDKPEAAVFGKNIDKEFSN